MRVETQKPIEKKCVESRSEGKGIMGQEQTLVLNRFFVESKEMTELVQSIVVGQTDSTQLKNGSTFPYSFCSALVEGIVKDLHQHFAAEQDVHECQQLLGTSTQCSNWVLGAVLSASVSRPSSGGMRETWASLIWWSLMQVNREFQTFVKRVQEHWEREYT